MAEKSDTDNNARERLSTRMRMFEQIVKALRVTASAGGKLALAGLRGAMPALEFYSGVRASEIEAETAGEDGERGMAGMLGLKRGEARVIRAAGTKAVLELVEIASVTHPVYEGAPKYKQMSEANVRQAPHLVHVLALAAAVNDYFGRDETPGKDEGEQPLVNPKQSVAYVSVAPGEYAVISRPLQPREIRRYAMRQRSTSQPQLAMLASSSDPASIVGVPGQGQPMAMGMASMQAAPMMGQGAAQLAVVRSYGSGCEATPHGTRMFPPARYDADGNCVSVSDISCETQWRVRECFKVAFCDMLKCLGDELCEDGKFADDPDLGGCIESFVCSLLQCLPEAICPPPEKEVCCVPDHGPARHCNFAVGE